MSLKAQEVFVPGAYPQHTYITRKAEGLEDSLKDSLSTPGQVVSLSGPSKSGKTVLVERVVGRDLLIPISGASLQGPDDVWNRVLDWMDVPSSTKGSKSSEWGLGADIGIKGDMKRESATEAVRERSGLTQVVHEIGNSDFVVLLDDFHYMNRSVQVEVAKTLKEAVRLGIKVVTRSGEPSG
jgi:hypothetical protein